MSNENNKYSKWAFREKERRSWPLSQEAMIIGIATGAVTGTVVGRLSLFSGLALMAGGYFGKIPVMTSFGAGMAVSGGYEYFALSGTGIQGVKDRLNALGQNFKHRLYLDKILTPKTDGDVQQFTGLGKVQYFQYPSKPELDFSEVERIKNELAQSALRFHQQQQSTEVGERLY